MEKEMGICKLENQLVKQQEAANLQRKAVKNGKKIAYKENVNNLVIFELYNTGQYKKAEIARIVGLSNVDFRLKELKVYGTKPLTKERYELSDCTLEVVYRYDADVDKISKRFKQDRDTVIKRLKDKGLFENELILNDIKKRKEEVVANKNKPLSDTTLMELVAAGVKPSEIARIFGWHRNTIIKWINEIKFGR